MKYSLGHIYENIKYMDGPSTCMVGYAMFFSSIQTVHFCRYFSISEAAKMYKDTTSIFIKNLWSLLHVSAFKLEASCDVPHCGLLIGTILYYIVYFWVTNYLFIPVIMSLYVILTCIFYRQNHKKYVVFGNIFCVKSRLKL